MFNIEFEGDPGFGEGDEVEVVTAIRLNDIVVFEPSGPGLVKMRALGPGEVEGYTGQTYRAGKGDEPGSVLMTAL